MKTVFKLSVLSVSLIAAINAVAATPTNAQLQNEIRAIIKHDQQLQREVKMLKTQLQTGHAVSHSHVLVSTSPASGPASSQSTLRPLPGRVILDKFDRPVTVTMPVHPNTEKVLLDRFDHPITVTTSPLMGPTANVTDILEQMSKDNQQLTLLQQRAALMKVLLAEGDTDLYRPIIELSGGLEGQLYGVDGFGKGSQPTGVNLSTAEFDVSALVGPWAGGFFALDYDNSPTSTGNRSPKGTAYVDRGFATLGNLNRFPMYVSIGEMYDPFGRYGSLMLTTPITQSLARIKTDTAMLGFAERGLYATVFGYNGSQTSGPTRVFKQGGVDLGYQRNFGPNASNAFTIGNSVVSNLADSQGLQSTGVDGQTGKFAGFAYNNDNDIAHRVPAYSVYGNVTYGNLTAISTFVTAVESFAASDLTYGNTGGVLSGAEPKALHTELDYTIHIYDRAFTLGADYDRSWQALAANLPQQSFAADLQTSWFRNTVEQIEYRHDDDYSSARSANGGGGTVFSGTGETRNSYIAQLGVYF